MDGRMDKWIDGRMDKWIDARMDGFNFTSISTVFLSYQDNWRINGTLFRLEKISPLAGLELCTARYVGQRLTL